eukprot:4832015-Pleurochrysis_carterae.AAC.1
MKEGLRVAFALSQLIKAVASQLPSFPTVLPFTNKKSRNLLTHAYNSRSQANKVMSRPATVPGADQTSRSGPQAHASARHRPHPPQPQPHPRAPRF